MSGATFRVMQRMFPTHILTASDLTLQCYKGRTWTGTKASRPCEQLQMNHEYILVIFVYSQDRLRLSLARELTHPAGEK